MELEEAGLDRLGVLVRGFDNFQKAVGSCWMLSGCGRGEGGGGTIPWESQGAKEIHLFHQAGLGELNERRGTTEWGKYN